MLETYGLGSGAPLNYFDLAFLLLPLWFFLLNRFSLYLSKHSNFYNRLYAKYRNYAFL